MKDRNFVKVPVDLDPALGTELGPPELGAELEAALERNGTMPGTWVLCLYSTVGAALPTALGLGLPRTYVPILTLARVEVIVWIFGSLYIIVKVILTRV
jgi:hypothetical protein